MTTDVRKELRKSLTSGFMILVWTSKWDMCEVLVLLYLLISLFFYDISSSDDVVSESIRNGVRVLIIRML